MLDIGGRCHSKMMRKYHKAINGNYVVSPDAIQILHDLQMRYFENMNRLPDDLQEMHKLVMIDLVDVMENKREKLTGHRWESDRETFYQGHERYMMIEKEITTQISNALKKMYFT